MTFWCLEYNLGATVFLSFGYLQLELLGSINLSGPRLGGETEGFDIDRLFKTKNGVRRLFFYLFA